MILIKLAINLMKIKNGISCFWFYNSIISLNIFIISNLVIKILNIIIFVYNNFILKNQLLS